MYINGGKVATLDVSTGKGSHDTILHLELRNVTLLNLFVKGGWGWPTETLSVTFSLVTSVDQWPWKITLHYCLHPTK